MCRELVWPCLKKVASARPVEQWSRWGRLETVTRNYGMFVSLSVFLTFHAQQLFWIIGVEIFVFSVTSHENDSFHFIRIDISAVRMEKKLNKTIFRQNMNVCKSFSFLVPRMALIFIRRCPGNYRYGATRLDDFSVSASISLFFSRSRSSTTTTTYPNNYDDWQWLLHSFDTICMLISDHLTMFSAGIQHLITSTRRALTECEGSSRFRWTDSK